MSDFKDLVDVDGLTPEEEARLRRVHELLLRAGPPEELPPTLAAPGAPPQADVIQFAPVYRRRVGAALVAAAAVAAAAFGGGYLLGHSKGFNAERTVAMHSTHAGVSALAVLKVAAPDSVGNWPMEMTVRGLRPQTARADYYELWLTKHGKLAVPCGTFRVHSRTTTVRFTVPYELKRFDGWVITVHQAGQPEPGRVVLTT
jgi:hypothetical protein